MWLIPGHQESTAVDGLERGGKVVEQSLPAPEPYFPQDLELFLLNIKMARVRFELTTKGL